MDNAKTISFTSNLGQEDWDKNLHGWRCSLLKIPGAKVDGIFTNGRLIDSAKYQIVDEHSIIRWSDDNQPEKILASISLTKELTTKELSTKWRKLAILLPFFATIVTLIVTTLTKEQTKNNDPKEPLIQIHPITDINGLWQPLMSDLNKLNFSSAPAEKNLDLLGLTLYASWGQLLPWLKQETTKGWTINLYCISPSLAKKDLKNYIPKDWINDVENRTIQVKGFIAENRANLEQREVIINFHYYDFVPAVHGFRLGNGKIYMSITHWSTKTNMLDYDSHPYEVVNPNDTSALAKIKRIVFENWLTRARR